MNRLFLLVNLQYLASPHLFVEIAINGVGIMAFLKEDIYQDEKLDLYSPDYENLTVIGDFQYRFSLI